MKYSIIVPCLNEEKSIEELLLSLVKQDNIEMIGEVIISDGMSIDRTRDIISSYIDNFSDLNVKLIIVDNINKTTSAGLNKAVETSSFSRIIRLDAHSKIDSDYISEIDAGFDRTNSDLVGPSIKYYNKQSFGAAVCAVINSKFGNGGTESRNGLEKTGVKHAVMSCYDKGVWVDLGGYDENLKSNEDFDFDYRAYLKGYRISSLSRPTYYALARDSSLAFARQRFRYGYWKYKVVRKHPKSLQTRQFVPILYTSFFIMAIPVPFLLSILVIPVLMVGCILKLQNKGVKILDILVALMINYHCWSLGFMWAALEELKTLGKNSIRRGKI